MDRLFLLHCNEYFASENLKVESPSSHLAGIGAGIEFIKRYADGAQAGTSKDGNNQPYRTVIRGRHHPPGGMP
jgi:hypothetical protein